jgi:ABC-type Mn2+/Zn2+ transport system ATPase subunit
MSDVRRAQTSDSNQSKIETNDMLVVSGLGVTLQNKTILEDVSFKAKKGISLAIVGPNGGGKSTVFRALLNLVPYTGTIRWNDKVRMGYVPQSLVSTDLPISVEEFLRFKCRTDFETCINSVGLEKAILRQSLGSLSGGELQRVLIAWAIRIYEIIFIYGCKTCVYSCQYVADQSSIWLISKRMFIEPISYIWK